MEVGRKVRMKLRDGAARDRSFLVVFGLDDPPSDPGSFTDLEDFEDPNELSSVGPKDAGPPLCEGYPTAAS